jgi:hypothetical protein
MQQPKDSQQLFNEKIANGTMTKEELENTPTCLRHFDEAEDVILKAGQVIDLPPPLFGPRPMTIGGSSIFRDPNYDYDGNPIVDTNVILTEEEIRLLKPPKDLKRQVAQVLVDEEEKTCRCILM